LPLFLTGHLGTPDEQPSHEPSEWTLGANCALADAMETLGWSHITLLRTSPTAPSYKFAHCSQKENILYMANTINAINAMETRMLFWPLFNSLRKTMLHMLVYRAYGNAKMAQHMPHSL
jgi:hypothetical protein